VDARPDSRELGAAVSGSGRTYSNKRRPKEWSRVTSSRAHEGLPHDLVVVQRQKQRGQWSTDKIADGTEKQPLVESWVEATMTAIKGRCASGKRRHLCCHDCCLRKGHRLLLAGDESAAPSKGKHNRHEQRIASSPGSTWAATHTRWAGPLEFTRKLVRCASR